MISKKQASCSIPNLLHTSRSAIVIAEREQGLEEDTNRVGYMKAAAGKLAQK